MRDEKRLHRRGLSSARERVQSESYLKCESSTDVRLTDLRVGNDKISYRFHMRVWNGT